MNFLLHFVSMIPSTDSAAVATIALGAEVMMRYIPSQKPLSILHSVAEGCHVVGDGLGKIAALMDRIFGQIQATPQASNSAK